MGVIGAGAGLLAAAVIVLVVSVVAGWVVVMQPGTAIIALTAGFAMTVLASLYPASRAAAMEPLDALRAE